MRFRGSVMISGRQTFVNVQKARMNKRKTVFSPIFTFIEKVKRNFQFPMPDVQCPSKYVNDSIIHLT